MAGKGRRRAGRCVGTVVGAVTLAVAASVGWVAEPMSAQSPGGENVAPLPRPAVDEPAANPPLVAHPFGQLPGLQRDGTVQLPNQWKLQPAGRHLEVGDFPVHIEVHPTGQYAAVLHCGMRDHEVVIIDLAEKNRRIVSRVTIPQAFYGLAFSPDGRQVYASGGEFDVVHVWDFDKGLLHNARTVDVSAPELRRVVPAGLALDEKGNDLLVCGLWADVLVRVPLTNPANKVIIPLRPVVEKPAAEKPQGDPPSPPDGRKESTAPKGSAQPGKAAQPPKKKVVAVEDEYGGVRPQGLFPYAVLVEPGSRRAFVSLWADAAIAVIDLENNRLLARWPTESHPTEMVLAPDGRTLYVACANSTKISVLDTGDGKPLQVINAALYPQAPVGNTPNSLCLTPDGQILIVANADANNLALFNVTDRQRAKPLGFIPAGWYPTSVRYNRLDKTIYFTNGKGVIARANRSGPNPQKPQPSNLIEYIGSLYRGTFAYLPMPTPEQMARFSKQAYECSPLRADNAPRAEDVAADNPIPRKLGEPSPIKYVIYIIKENRTYDQVFGDLAAGPHPIGNGDPELCLFPEPVTPNHHKIAREFVLLDNFYVDGEVSADGHEWSMGAYATDFVEKLWPLTYRGSPRKTFGYPAEGLLDPAARPAGGYLWDRAREAGVSYRSYGEWIDNGAKNPDGTFQPGKARVKALEGHFDPWFRGYDLEYPDVKRAERFISELRRFEKEGDMPRLQIVRLPNDHTAGTRVGMLTPTAYVADNDLALGLIVEAVSHSKFWKQTAIFVVEDDAQNGPDHVDAHRTVALVISPYTKRRFVDSTLYSTSSMLRTMELILGLKPMSQFDAAARPMYNSFTSRPDFTPYKHEVPRVDMKELNKPTAWGAERAARFDLSKEDAADDLLFNEVIWKAVKGPDSPMPPPVRAAFFIPVRPAVAKDDDDD
ncbi:MAG: beta-propeller fold lactonase family protein [Gemmataceae bacterium]|nr:beta-propeller fold lactonase family protein [Gemmataceae bacterium]MDW8244176.1 alkaline phosphatase family protein [Thermogemmata sp.]